MFFFQLLLQQNVLLVITKMQINDAEWIVFTFGSPGTMVAPSWFYIMSSNLLRPVILQHPSQENPPKFSSQNLRKTKKNQ